MVYLSDQLENGHFLGITISQRLNLKVCKVDCYCSEADIIVASLFDDMAFCQSSFQQKGTHHPYIALMCYQPAKRLTIVSAFARTRKLLISKMMARCCCKDTDRCSYSDLCCV